MLSIPDPDAENEFGESIDVLEYLRGKKEMARQIVPRMYEFITTHEEDFLEASPDRYNRLKRTLEEIAKSCDIDLGQGGKHP